ncbi:Carbamate kinase (fragment) [Candidatus Sulfotelmatobacter kueseliae]|uniref:Carbamate kinase n=1 Tax=Candidatus Sulfotelmatobacter kueseliae TaxID=2042962 RepID=A0A2U3K899_9BACT
MKGCQPKRLHLRVRASALLATQLGADVFAISTDTDYVYLDYKRPTQRPLKLLTASEMEAHCKVEHFPPGNMGPKVESVLRFLRRGGKEAVITTYDHLCDAVDGTAGTRIVSDPAGAGTPGNSSELSSGLPTRGR